ncbi:methyltransferase [Bacteroidia bacterium]|nr:methyltransferase [Bacteroidia bacterium]MDB4106998.1 methyltransferase [Bacteroidia bacterium]MDB9882458.1 methyltransferase [Bacteroidia bacterium]
MQYNNKTINLQRYPNTTNRSLRPWSAADELLLFEAQKIGLEDKTIALGYDTFGALAIALHKHKPHSIINHNSQLKATKLNLDNNGLDSKDFEYVNPLNIKTKNVDLVLLKVPKSLELFQLIIQQFHSISNDGTSILCGFMTRNFTASVLEIAKEYFEDVSQSLAVKKARVLILKKPKNPAEKSPLFHSVKNDLDLNLKQYSGVFSSNKIDKATIILLENLPAVSAGAQILDLACGNGVIAAYVQKQEPTAQISVIDDNFLAIASAKLNLGKENINYHWSDTVTAVRDQKFDLILCNPPFHFEYENTIEISLRLFKEAKNALKQNGAFYIVANTHLNYRTHLAKLFKEVRQVVQSGKYEVLCCAN